MKEIYHSLKAFLTHDSTIIYIAIHDQHHGRGQKGTFHRKFNVPFWALSHVFGRNSMYWYRIEQALG